MVVFKCNGDLLHLGIDFLDIRIEFFCMPVIDSILLQAFLDVGCVPNLFQFLFIGAEFWLFRLKCWWKGVYSNPEVKELFIKLRIGLILWKSPEGLEVKSAGRVIIGNDLPQFVLQMVVLLGDQFDQLAEVTRVIFTLFQVGVLLWMMLKQVFYSFSYCVINVFMSTLLVTSRLKMFIVCNYFRVIELDGV